MKLVRALVVSSLSTIVRALGPYSVAPTGRPEIDETTNFVGLLGIALPDLGAVPADAVQPGPTFDCATTGVPATGLIGSRPAAQRSTAMPVF